MAENRKRLINLHTPTLNKKPIGELSLGEIAVEHSSVEGAKLYVETSGSSTSENTIATFITSAATVNIINDAVSDAVSGLTNIVDALTDIVITGGTGDNIITVSTINPDASANTLTITHKTGAITSGFNKLETDSYGHVTGSTAVTISDVSGLTGFQTAVRNVETKLSTGTTSGDGKFITGATVNDHEITLQKANIVASDVTDLNAAILSAQTQLSYSSNGTGNAITEISVNNHAITATKGATFSVDGHKHIGEDITGGTVGISYLPTATTVDMSDNNHVPTSKAVYEAIQGAVTSTMNYKGATDSVPSASTKGDLYVASANFTVPSGSSATDNAENVEKGDFIVANEDEKWDVIQKNIDGAVTSTGMTDQQIVIANGANTIISKDSAQVKVGSATTATNLDVAPTLEVSDNDKITVTAGGKTSAALTVPFATSATTSVSATSVPLSGVTDADDLKAIEALTGTSGILNKTAENTWDLVNVIKTKAEYSGLTSDGSLIDAHLAKEIITENELATAAALNDLNDRTNILASSANSLDARVTDLENTTVDLSGVASAITVNGNVYTVSNGGVNIGSYLSASTQYVSAISQETTASAVTTTFTVINGNPSTYNVIQDIIIDCGTY